MWIDPIVAKIREGREEYAERFDYDLKRIGADLRQSEKKRLLGKKVKAKAASKLLTSRKHKAA